MYLNIFKLFLIFNFFMLSYAFSESITFKLPNGWIKNYTLSKKDSVLVFTPGSLNSLPPSEVLKISIENLNIGANSLLSKNMNELKNLYSDFKFYNVKFDFDDSMGLGCTVSGGFCTVQRIEKYNGNLFVYIYTNNTPHYSQGLFGKWTNICAQIKAGSQTITDKHQEVFEI